MSPAKLTPAEQRRMEALAPQVDRVSQADRRFFERFAHRRHRLRLAHRAEIEQFAILHGVPNLPTPPVRVFIAVKFLEPGMRIRLPVVRIHNGGDEAGEDEARFIFEMAAEWLGIPDELVKL